MNEIVNYPEMIFNLKNPSNVEYKKKNWNDPSKVGALYDMEVEFLNFLSFNQNGNYYFSQNYIHYNAKY